MKRIATLFIFLIGMISQTSIATTPLMEQKQKTTISEPVMQVVNVANVDDAVFTCDAVFFVNGNLQFNSGRGYEPIKTFQAVFLNNGYSLIKRQFKQIHYSEKLHLNYIQDKEKALQVIGLDNARSNC